MVSDRVVGLGLEQLILYHNYHKNLMSHWEVVFRNSNNISYKLLPLKKRKMLLLVRHEKKVREMLHFVAGSDFSGDSCFYWREGVPGASVARGEAKTLSD